MKDSKCIQKQNEDRYGVEENVRREKQDNASIHSSTAGYFRENPKTSRAIFPLAIDHNAFSSL